MKFFNDQFSDFSNKPMSIPPNLSTPNTVTISVEKLKHMQEIPIMELKREELSKAEDIVIDRKKSTTERMASFLEQTKNPFAQNVGDYILQVGFAEETKEGIDDRILLLSRRKTIP